MLLHYMLNSDFNSDKVFITGQATEILSIADAISSFQNAIS